MDKFYEEPENYTQEMLEDSSNEQEEQYIGEKSTDYTLPKGLQTIPDKRKMMLLTVFLFAILIIPAILNLCGIISKVAASIIILPVGVLTIGVCCYLKYKYKKKVEF